MNLIPYFVPSGQFSNPVGMSFSNAAPAIHQTERAGNVFWDIHGYAGQPGPFAEHYFDERGIYLVYDCRRNPPFALRDSMDKRGSLWCPTSMELGEIFKRECFVLDINPRTGAIDHASPHKVTTYIKLVAHHVNWKGINDVIRLDYFTDAECTQWQESYYRAMGGTLVGFQDASMWAMPNYAWPDKPPAPGIPVLARQSVMLDQAETINPRGEEITVKSGITASVREQPSVNSNRIAVLNGGAVVMSIGKVDDADKDKKPGGGVWKWYEVKPRGYMREDLFTTYERGNFNALWLLPFAQSTITQGESETHKAIDFGVPVGSAVVSPAVGRVSFILKCSKCTKTKPNFPALGIPMNDRAALNNPAYGYGYGNAVCVTYAWPVLPEVTKDALAKRGLSGAFVHILYAHLSEAPVNAGDCVGRAGIIGLSGNTGNSDGPHLHMECFASMEAQIDSVFDRARVSARDIFYFE